MFYIKHRWMVNRNLVHSTLVISFNEKGYAAIQNMGNNRPMAEAACVASRGNMSIVESIEPSPKPEEKPVVEEVVLKPAAAKPLRVEGTKKDEMVRALIEDEVVGVMTSASGEEKVPPPKKKTTKKTFGKK